MKEAFRHAVAPAQIQLSRHAIASEYVTRLYHPRAHHHLEFHRHNPHEGKPIKVGSNRAGISKGWLRITDDGNSWMVTFSTKRRKKPLIGARFSKFEKDKKSGLTIALDPETAIGVEVLALQMHNALKYGWDKIENSDTDQLTENKKFVATAAVAYEAVGKKLEPVHNAIKASRIAKEMQYHIIHAYNHNPHFQYAPVTPKRTPTKHKQRPGHTHEEAFRMG